MSAGWLCVSDSRLGRAKRPPSREYRFTFKPRPGATLRDLIDLVNEHLAEDTEVVVVNTFHCDVTTVQSFNARHKGLMKMKNPVPIAEYVNKVVLWDHFWRQQYQVEPFWVLPYTPDFYLYNQRRAKFRAPEGDGLDAYNQEEALAAPALFGSAITKIRQALNCRGVATIETEGWLPPGALGESVSDGLHVSEEIQGCLLQRILEKVETMRPLPASLEYAPSSTSSKSEARRLKRKRNRTRKFARQGAALKTQDETPETASGNVSAPPVEEVAPDPLSTTFLAPDPLSTTFLSPDPSNTTFLAPPGWCGGMCSGASHYGYPQNDGSGPSRATRRPIQAPTWTWAPK